MATDEPSTAVRTPQAELDAIMNRIQVSLAQKEALVRSWTAKSKATDIEPRKTDAELDAEDALLFRPEPAYLGVGCPIPENFMISEAERSKKTLEAKFRKGLQASKRRDAEEKAESAKRALRDDSSDEEGGRSSLGKKKKRLKIAAVAEPAKQVEEVTETEEIKKVKNIKKIKEIRAVIEDKEVRVNTEEAVNELEQVEQVEHGSKKSSEDMAEQKDPLPIRSMEEKKRLKAARKVEKRRLKRLAEQEQDT